MTTYGECSKLQVVCQSGICYYEKYQTVSGVYNGWSTYRLITLLIGLSYKCCKVIYQSLIVYNKATALLK
jgi:hypothetical protein